MSVGKSVLGRGFEGLIPTDFNVDDVASPKENIKQIALELITANPDQPRKEFDKSALAELAQSIKQHGIIQPLIVTPHKDKYKIVAGERRYRASQIANLKKIPVIVRNHEELEELEIALVENVQRVDLSPLEQAVSIVRLRDQFSLSIKDISNKLGKAETTLSNIVRLLQLPKEAFTALQKNLISEGHARAILALRTDEEAQKELLSKIIVQKLSVRQAESFVKRLKGKVDNSKTQQNPATKTLLKNLSAPLASAIKIKETSKASGSIILKYKTQEELKTYLNKLDS